MVGINIRLGGARLTSKVCWADAYHPWILRERQLSPPNQPKGKRNTV
ncbi:MAG: hypothetical protein JWQ69_117 [Pseudomonas sp.]|nr:hypothetical protein [Pseudomonas sp.]